MTIVPLLFKREQKIPNTRENSWHAYLYQTFATSSWQVYPALQKFLQLKQAPHPWEHYVYNVRINYRVFKTKTYLSKHFDQLPLQYSISQVFAYTSRFVLLTLIFLGVQIYPLKSGGSRFAYKLVGWSRYSTQHRPEKTFSLLPGVSHSFKENCNRTYGTSRFCCLSHNKEASYQKQRLRSEQSKKSTRTREWTAFIEPLWISNYILHTLFTHYKR